MTASGTALRRIASRWRLLTGATLLLVVLAGASGAVWYRATYHLWPGQGVPPRIHWCGRDYDRGPGPAVSHAEVARTLGADPVVVMRVPPLGPRHDLVAATTEREVRRREPSASGCATLVYLRLGPGRYRVYELQGSL
ncbi:hypothetical protein [Miltoncostaea oceani]|uniref:hypothetical protein n=1 Tax=Miltoncostaea oceani TaxID=2843216 RepID=UPI001C3E72DA|nr:hypothetical protein [Miltoncostaea oceani]